MGLFDYIRCRYPLPLPEGVTLPDDFWFQTKDTPRQYMNSYEIREDGTLWHEDYDVEDRSPAAKWQAENPGKKLPEGMTGLARFRGCMTHVNKRWEPVDDFRGEIRFYSSLKENATGADRGWIEFSAYFVEGKFNQVHLIEYQEPESSPRHPLYLRKDAKP